VVEPTPGASEEQLEDWEYDFYDDDASMGESDDEFSSALRDSRLSLDQPGIVASQRFDHQYHMFGTHTRTFSTYGAETVLATYDPSPANSPLTDKHIAAVFWHFINVTGPSMSLYERHPLDPSNVFQGQVTKKQHQWTCKHEVTRRHKIVRLIYPRCVSRHVVQPPSTFTSYACSW
jgi:hypothetical protein